MVIRQEEVQDEQTLYVENIGRILQDVYMSDQYWFIAKR